MMMDQFSFVSIFKSLLVPLIKCSMESKGFSKESITTPTSNNRFPLKFTFTHNTKIRVTFEKKYLK